MRTIWKNGELLPESEATVSVYDSALMMGDQVFEMTRSFKGRTFQLMPHLLRLYQSARCLCIDMPPRNEMYDNCLRVVAANEFQPDDEHRLLITVSRGALGIYHDTGAHKGTNIIITDFPLRWTVAGMGRLYDEGINAVIPSQRAIPSTLLDARVKHRSRLYLQMANIEVAQVKGDRNWALLLDPDGYIAEGTGANFHIVKGECIYTPEPRNVLAGVSMAYVKELAGKAGIRYEEKNLLPYDVYNADEAFFTGTPFCILPVTSLNGRTIGGGKLAGITRHLLRKWSFNMDVDIIKQIKAWEGEVSGPSPYQFKGAA